MRAGRFVILLALVTLVAVACEGRTADPITAGQARIRYLGHAGWLVRTSEHTMLFDYTGEIDGGGALSNGSLSAEVLSGQQVLLFVSHAHGDHYKPRVLNLRDAVENLTVVLGWEDPAAGPAVVPADGVWTDVGGASVFALHHDYDGIAEGFFLVRSGGLVIYHSGDHGTWSDPPNEVFRTHIDRLSKAAGRIDIAFLSAFGERGSREGLNQGDVYSIRTLKPRVTFPMHCGGCEDRYSAFAREAAALGLPTTVGLADKPGAFFVFQDGSLVSQVPTPSAAEAEILDDLRR